MMMSGQQQIAERSGVIAPPSPADTGERLVDAEKLMALSRDVFVRAGMPFEEADLVADALVLADLRGMQSHGVLRVPIYVEKIRGGGFITGRKGRVVRETAGTVLLDGENGIGQVITVAAMDF